MIKTTPLDSDNSKLIKEWYLEDELGNQFIGSYSDPDSWIKLLDKDKRWGYIICDNENAVGFFDLEHLENKKGGFSFYVAPNMRGKGYGNIVLQELREFAKRKNIKVLYAGVENENMPSIKVMEKFGFKKVGVDKDEMVEYELQI